MPHSKLDRTAKHSVYAIAQVHTKRWSAAALPFIQHFFDGFLVLFVACTAKDAA
jgi:hypothetical protein